MIFYMIQLNGNHENRSIKFCNFQGKYDTLQLVVAIVYPIQICIKTGYGDKHRSIELLMKYTEQKIYYQKRFKV